MQSTLSGPSPNITTATATLSRSSLSEHFDFFAPANLWLTISVPVSLTERGKLEESADASKKYVVQ